MNASAETTYKKGFRFRPPAVEVPAGFNWLVSRACGPIERSLATVAPTTQELLRPGVHGIDLAGRIWARTPEAVLNGELSQELLGGCRSRFHAAVALSLRHREVGRRVVESAAGLGAETVVLKGLALELGGYSSPGARLAVDVDLLLSVERVEPVFRGLLREGSRALDLPEEPHHLPPLSHPLGSTVELHRELRGVNLRAGRTATLADCLEEDLCRPVPELAEGAHIPNRELLTAHLLVHGLGQHGNAPESYPMLQLLGDLQDLGVGRAGFSPSRNDQIMDWIGDMVSHEEVAAAEDLLRRLESGELPTAILEASDFPSLLLRHMIAGQVSEDYRRSLKLGRQFGSSPGTALIRQTVRSTSRTLRLTDGQIDIVYGTPKSRLGYWGWRLWRPFDLVGRSVRSVRAWMKVRSGGAGK